MEVKFMRDSELLAVGPIHHVSTEGGARPPKPDPIFEGDGMLPMNLDEFKKEYNRADYLADFKQIVDEMVDLTTRKNNDYGGATDPWKNFREFGELGILVRMSDKWARIKSALVEKRELKVADESVEDTIKDLAVYAIILMIWRRRNGG